MSSTCHADTGDDNSQFECRERDNYCEGVHHHHEAWGGPLRIASCRTHSRGTEKTESYPLLPSLSPRCVQLIGRGSAQPAHTEDLGEWTLSGEMRVARAGDSGTHGITIPSSLPSSKFSRIPLLPSFFFTSVGEGRHFARRRGQGRRRPSAWGWGVARVDNRLAQGNGKEKQEKESEMFRNTIPVQQS